MRGAGAALTGLFYFGWVSAIFDKLCKPKSILSVSKYIYVYLCVRYGRQRESASKEKVCRRWSQVIKHKAADEINGRMKKSGTEAGTERQRSHIYIILIAAITL